MVPYFASAMVIDPLNDTNLCPVCGADNSARPQAPCWMCHAPPNASAARPFLTTAPPVQFSLATMFLLMTLIAVCLGVFVLAPGLGILLAIVSLPALARTVMVAGRRRQAGRRMTFADKLSAFLASLVLAIATAVSVGVAFYVMCWFGVSAWVGLRAEAPFADALSHHARYNLLAVAAFGSGLIGGIIVAVLMFRRFWPIRNAD